MANSVHKMARKALFVYSICSLILINPVIKADTSLQFFDCGNTTITDSNLNTASDSTVSMCVGDVSSDVCNECLDHASRYAVEHCPEAKPVTIIYDLCSRYNYDSTPTIKGPDPNFLYVECPNATLSTTSTYQHNLNFLLDVLSYTSAFDGFYNFSAGTTPPNASHGLFLCRGDLSSTACNECVVAAKTEVLRLCPKSKWAAIWYDQCMLRYSDASIFAALDMTHNVMLPDAENVTEEPRRFNKSLGELMGKLSTQASSVQLGDKKFAAGKAKLTVGQTLYGLLQCSPDIRASPATSPFPYFCPKGQPYLFSSQPAAWLEARQLDALLL